MAPFTRQIKNESGTSTTSTSPSSPSSRIGVMDDPNNYAKDRPIRTSRNSNPRYKSSVVGDLNSILGRKKRSRRLPRPSLTRKMKQTIGKFLSNAIENPTRYVGSGQNIGKGIVDVKIVKNELLLKLRAVSGRRRPRRIYSSDVDRWLKNSSFTQLLKTLRRDPAERNRSDPMTSGAPAETIPSTLSEQSGSTLPVPMSDVIYVKTVEPASTQVTHSRPKPTKLNKKMKRSKSPYSVSSEANALLLPNSVNPQLPQFPSIQGSEVGTEQSRDSPKIVVSVADDSGNDGESEDGRRMDGEQDGNNWIPLPPPQPKAANVGPSLATDPLEHEGEQHINIVRWQQASAHPMLHENAPALMLQHPEVLEFFRRVRWHVDSISMLYEEMIVSQQHHHHSFEVFRHMLNTFSAFMDYMTR